MPHRAPYACAVLFACLLICALIGLSAPARAAGDLLGVGGCDPSRQSCSPGGGNPPPTHCTGSPGGQTCAGAEPASLGNTSGTPVGAGNPINVLTANKYQREVDLPPLPGVLGLELVRHYNSAFAQGDFPPGILGRGWKLSYETQLFETAHSVQIREADGSTLIFNRDAQQPSLCASQDASHGEVRIQTERAGSRYVWAWPNGRQLMFDARGKLVQIQAPTGEFVSLQYDPDGRLLLVTDPQGRQLRLVYRESTQTAQAGGGHLFRGVVAIDTPVGRYHYGYSGEADRGAPAQASVSAVPAGASALTNTAEARARIANLVRVDRPSTYDPLRPAHAHTERGTTVSSVSRRYHYEDDAHPGLLTGISVASAPDGERADTPKPAHALQRIVTWRYDAQGRAVLSVKGAIAPGSDVQTVSGPEAVQVRYDVPLPAWAGPPRTIGAWPLRATEITNSLGQKTLYVHTLVAGEYRLIEVRGVGCASCGPANVRYGYDRLGRLVEETTLSAAGEPLRTVRTTRDVWGRTLSVSAIDFVAGKAQTPRLRVRYEYAPVEPGSPSQLGGPVLIARPSVVPGQEHQLRIAYNGAGQPLSVTEQGYAPARSADAAPTPLSRTTTFAYATINGRSLLERIDGPLPNGPKGEPADSDVTRYVWDARGDSLSRIEYSHRLTARFDYDRSSGRPLSMMGVDGIVTRFTYAPDGALTQLDQAGAITRYRHDPLGRGIEVIDPTGQHLRFEWDAAHRIAGVRDGQNNRIALRRDSEGRLLQAQLLDPEGSPSQQRDSGQASSPVSTGLSDAGSRSPASDAVLQALGKLIAANADGARLARPELTQHPFERVAQFIDSALSDVDAPHQAVTHAPDNQGRLSTYWHNDFGELIAIDSPTTGRTRYAYDPAGRLSAQVNDDGSRSQYERDMAGRVVGLKSFGADGRIDEDARIEWASANKPSRIRYLAGEESFAYDAAGRLTEHAQDIDGVRFTLRYAYDAAGRLVSKTLPGGEQIEFRYRGNEHPRAGLLESVWLRGVFDRPIAQDFNSERDRYTHRSFVFGNGLSNQTVFDAAGRAVSAGNAQVGRTQLAYAQPTAPAAQQVGSEAEAETNPIHVTQTHTAQLSQYAQSQAAQALISRLRAMRPYGWELGTFGGQLSAAPFDFSGAGRAGAARFDARGRRVEQGRLRYRYDSLDRLVEVRLAPDEGSSDEAAPRLLAQYRYNLFGQRIKKLVYGSPANGGATSASKAKVTYFFYDGSHLVAQAGASDTPEQQFVWVNERPLALLIQGALLSVHADHRGAPLAVTDEARQLVWQAAVSDSLASSPRQGPRLGLIEFNLRGSNQYFDAETGLHYNTRRYFDPLSARYLSPDPLGLATGPDLYAFALGQPHRFVDPMGLAPIEPGEDIHARGFGDKLSYVVSKASEMLAPDIASALQDLVSPEAIATTVAVMALWAGSHAVGIGFAADALMLGVAYYTLGKAAADLILDLVDVTLAINRARCTSDLDAVGRQLSQATSKAATNAAVGVLLRGVFKRSEKDLGQSALNEIKRLTDAGKKAVVEAVPANLRLGFRKSAWGKFRNNSETGFNGELDANSILLGNKKNPLTIIGDKTLDPRTITTSAEYEAKLKAYVGQTGFDSSLQRRPSFFRRIVGGKEQVYIVESKATQGTFRGTPSELQNLLKGNKLKDGTYSPDQLSTKWIFDRKRLDQSVGETNRPKVVAADTEGRLTRMIAITDANGTRFFEVMPAPADEAKVVIGKEITGLF